MAVKIPRPVSEAAVVQSGWAAGRAGWWWKTEVSRSHRLAIAPAALLVTRRDA
jgi:hypothetical protein